MLNASVLGLSNNVLQTPEFILAVALLVAAIVVTFAVGYLIFQFTKELPDVPPHITMVNTSLFVDTSRSGKFYFGDAYRLKVINEKTYRNLRSQATSPHEDSVLVYKAGPTLKSLSEVQEFNIIIVTTISLVRWSASEEGTTPLMMEVPLKLVDWA